MSKKSLYLPSAEKDSCGIGFVANLKGVKSKEIVEDALTMLENMEHRGACGCEPNTGDGAGILIQVPHRYLTEECNKIGVKLPPSGGYAVGMIFFPPDDKLRERCRKLLNRHIRKLGLELLGYREVPTDNRGLGKTAVSVEPKIEQMFVRLKDNLYAPDILERRVFVLRKYTTHIIHHTVPGTLDHFYISSLSYKTMVYKGQLRADQIRTYYSDLRDERVISALAMVHSRFSTNTFPKWKLAQPFDYIAHNGEINTIQGNVNWMSAKEASMDSSLFTKEELQWMVPVCDPARSDSGNLDSIVELLVFGGRSLPHAMMMLIPEAWEEDEGMNERKKAFYEYHSAIMEPWDGPAAVCFTDGKVVGALLDRNGLRPARYMLTEDDKLILASEAGALPVDQSKVTMKGRIKPGRMFVADLEHGRVISDHQLKRELSLQQPYHEWLKKYRLFFDAIPPAKTLTYKPDFKTLLNRQLQFGFTAEDLQVILKPMAETGKEPIGSMGADIPLSVLSNQSQHFTGYFKQMFAQVSNPPIDPIRERLVMSLRSRISISANLLSESPRHCRQITFEHPVLTDKEAEKLRNIRYKAFKSKVLDTLFKASDKPGTLEKALTALCKQAEAAVRSGGTILFLSDRKASRTHAPIPSLLATAAVHHHLLDKGLRYKAGLVVEAGDIWETHHIAVLIGYGANVVNPYMAFETLADMNGNGYIESGLSVADLEKNYIKAVNGGLLKIMSKMGISTIRSYHGAQIYEALGISSKVIDKYFTGTVSRIEGLSFDGIAKEVLIRQRLAYPKRPLGQPRLQEGGLYQWKRKGEYHLFNPETVHLLQKASRNNDYDVYRQYARLINGQIKKACTLRGLLDFKRRKSIPLEEVEPVEHIFRRFATGAMSFGSISHEAHSTLAIAMNRIGAKSNSGEGGEDEIRYEQKSNGDWERSAIKQVASGRFGVTSHYLANAEELQIKIAQGAKPGEGGQLPGHKVDEWIGRVRHATPGVGLISPPPHHDIYSIEDLAQLIFDLKNANRHARINVKLVAESGVGTIAAGVAKAYADVILISGHDGGTGASPISSIRHAGLPWELGLAEAHQTLVKNDLRSRVTLQTDGQIRTGRDLAIAALLGAEEWGVSTAALVVEGCIMMRKCHLNTCPVGIATQNPELRKEFSGKPEHVINFFTFLAQDLREIMAELGFRTVNEMIGQADVLKVRKNIEHWKLKDVDLSPVIYKEPADASVGLYKQIEQQHALETAIDWSLIKDAEPAFKGGGDVYKEYDIYNVNRSIGTLLSYEISRKFGADGLPRGKLHFKFRGSAGQSFGAFSARGIRFELEGEANDYFGKGLSGAELIIYPDKQAQFDPAENIIIGNVALYGATSGEVFVCGLAGERFAVRNSGVTAIVEGVGDHGCEYMTGGTVVVLGETGKNFAAGMSGGVAYVYDEHERFSNKCNSESVDLETLEREDKLLLNSLIRKHYELTGSITARDLLIYWKDCINNFVKVMPRDYKRVLMQRKEEASQLKKVI